MVVDSGSTTTAIAAEGCADCEDAGVTTLYDTDHGTDRGKSASAAYASANITWGGDVYGDDLALAGVPSVAMDFVAVSEQTDFVYAGGSCDSDDGAVPLDLDGILGLGPDETLVAGTDSYLSSVVAQTDSPDAFALRLCHVGGTLWIGGYDPEEATEPMAFVPLADSWDYFVDVGGFEMEGDDGSTTSIPAWDHTGPAPGLLDSGGPSLILPDVAYDPIIASVAADPDFAMFGDITWFEQGRTSSRTTPEEVDAMLPWLRVDLVGSPDVQLALPPTESYMQWFSQGGGSYGYMPNIYSDSYLSEQVAEYKVEYPEYDWYDFGPDFFDFGNLVMKSYVVYTDRDAGTIGFAAGVACP